MTRAPSRIRLEVVQASDSGRDPNKQVNEDSSGYAECSLGHLLVLCDGMGGHHGGREASRTAISTIFEVIDRVPPHYSPAQALKAAVEEAGRRVYALGGPPENRMRPGSTVVAVLLHDAGVEVSHVGDSRAYVIRSNQIYPLTRDHSMVQGMIDAGMLTEEQAIGHPDLNKITRALGMKPDVDVEARPEPMEIFPGDMFLTTSDGLTDVTLNADILGCVRQALASGGLEHAATMLVKLANDRGGPDNITVQLAKVLEVVPKATIPDQPGAGVGSAAAGSLTSGPTAVGMTPPSSRPLTLAGAAAHPLIPSPAGSAYGPVSASGVAGHAQQVAGPVAHTPGPAQVAPHGPVSARQPAPHAHAGPPSHGHGAHGHGAHGHGAAQHGPGQHGQHGHHAAAQGQQPYQAPHGQQAQVQGPHAHGHQPYQAPHGQPQVHGQPAHGPHAHGQQAYPQPQPQQLQAQQLQAQQLQAQQLQAQQAHAQQLQAQQAQAQQAHAQQLQAQQAQAHAQQAHAQPHGALGQRPAGLPVAPTVADGAPASQRVAPTVPGPTLAESQAAKGMGAYRVEAQLPLPPRSQRFGADAAVAPALMAPAWSPPASDQRARNNLIALVFGGATGLAVLILLVLWLVYK